MLSAGEIPNCFQSSCVNFAVNWGLQSDTILVGRPCRLNTLFWKSVVVSSAIIVFLQGVMIIPLDSPWSTTTLIES